MYHEDLKDLLRINKNISSVWLDEKGNWHTREMEDCEEVTREEIIGGDTTEEVVETPVTELIDEEVVETPVTELIDEEVVETPVKPKK